MPSAKARTIRLVSLLISNSTTRRRIISFTTIVVVVFKVRIAIALDHASVLVVARLDVLPMTPDAVKRSRSTLEQRSKKFLERLKMLGGGGFEGVGEGGGDRVWGGILEKLSQRLDLLALNGSSFLFCRGWAGTASVCALSTMQRYENV